MNDYQIEKNEAIAKEMFELLHQKLSKEYGDDIFKHNVLITASLFFSALKSAAYAGEITEPNDCFEQIRKVIEDVLGRPFDWGLHMTIEGSIKA